MATLAGYPTLAAGSADRGRMGWVKTLRAGGIAAGPFYITVSLAQALTRPGFDLRHHDISLLANGPLGWIQIGNFLVSGLLALAAAAGMRLELSSGRGRTSGPWLVGLYGLCIALAGIFVADPAGGFPPGSPAAPNVISWHGSLHLLCAAVGFLALIAACFIFGRRFRSEGRSAWMVYSLATGVVFLVCFFGGVILSASTPGSSLSVASLWVAVLAGWTWLSVMSAEGVQA